VWDISGISFETSADQIRSFANPILTAIANKTPDYQDDFNNPNSGWPDESTPDGDQWGYVERTYSLTVTRRYRNPTGDSCLDIKPNTEPQFSDFVWEASAQFVTDSPGSLHIFFRDMPPTSQHPIDTSYFMGLFPDGTFFLHKNLNTNQVNQINMVEGPFTPPLLTGTGKNRLLLIAQKSKMAVYANDQPLVLINDTTWQAGNIFLQFGACNNSESDTPLQVRFDDLKVWNITDLLP
jgi:hypothetical protein